MNLCVNGWYFEVEPSHHWPDIGAGGAVDAASPGRGLNKKITEIMKIMKITKITALNKNNINNGWPVIYFCCAPIFFVLYNLFPTVK